MLRRRVLLFIAGGLGLLLVTAAIVGWAIRFKVAGRLIDERLAATDIPSSYRLTALTFEGAEIQELRLGDPAKPDLVAGHLHVTFGYSWHGPYVAGVSGSGIRLVARFEKNRLSLGALDKLLPHGGQGPALPDLPVRLDDTQVVLATPAGPLRIRLDGKGNPQRRFAGELRLEGTRLAVGPCRFGAPNALMQVEVVKGASRLTGPITLASAACPPLALGPGRLVAQIQADPTFRTLTVRAIPQGFGGNAGPMRFANVGGVLTASRRSGHVTAQAEIKIGSISAPDLAPRIAALPSAISASPIGPTANQASKAVSALLSRADAKLHLTVDETDSRFRVAVHGIEVAGGSGARLTITPRGRILWSPAGLSLDVDVRSSGGDLPAVQATLRQSAPDQPIIGAVKIAPYEAGAGRVSLAPTAFSWTQGRLQFDGAATISGPFAGGFVSDLSLPIDGEITRGGAIQAGQGCRNVSFAALQIGSARFGHTAIHLCGNPVLSRTVEGSLNIAASTSPLRLAGHIGSAPALATADAVRITAHGFDAAGVTATFGREPMPTRLTVQRLAGAWREGSFAGAGGTIGSVPLRLSDAQGRWTLAGGALRLTGALSISDMAASARFRGLAIRDADFTLSDGQIAATGAMTEPRHNVVIAHVRLDHDLADGMGAAVLSANAIRFQPKGLQPDDLTPLTLGVIANVAGTVEGEGVIHWSPAGTTSQGKFGTEGLDLAAAFGPVTGLAGRVRFTDLLGLVSAPDQQVRVAEINPGVAIDDGRIRFHLPGQNRVAVDGATWPFAGGTLKLKPTVVDLSEGVERHLTFTIAGLDAAKFVQQLDFPNIAATGTFDGTLPMVFDTGGGRIVSGSITARPPGGTLAYVGELSSAQLGLMGKFAFDALKAIRYSSLKISLDGRLDGEMVSLVSFTGVRQATPEQGLAARLIRNLPFRFNIKVRAPFRGLVGSARSYADPRLLLTAPTPVQPPASAAVP